MDNHKFSDEIFCDDNVFNVEKNNFLKNLLRFTILNLVIMMIFTHKNIMGFIILELVSLMFSIAALMFVIHSSYFSELKLYKVLKFHLGLICIIYIIRLFPNGYFGGIYFRITDIKILWDNNFNFILMYYLIANYRCKNTNRIYIDYIFWTGVKGILYIISSRHLLTWLIPNVCLSIELLLLIIAFYRIRRKKIIENNKINIFSINLIMSIIAVFVTLIFQGGWVTNFSIIKFVIYESCMLSLMLNLIQSTYNFIFKETYEENNKLEIINNRIKVRNIEMERSQEFMMEREGMYRNFLGVIPKPIVKINTLNNRIFYCNKSFLSLIGEKNIRNVINKKLDSIIEHNIYFNDFFNLDKNKGYMALLKGKEPRNLEIRLLKIDEYNNKIMFSLEDITEKVEMEKMKKEMEENKLKDILKKNFLSNISHDLKTPINVIYSAVQIDEILISNNDINSLRKYNDISQKNCLTLIQLTNNLIDISKINIAYLHPKLEVRNIVSDIEEKVISLAEYVKNKNINMIFDTSEEEIYVNIDKEFIERIILNLISNSVKFTKSGGYIYITITADYEKVYIEIKDTGKGMSKDFTRQAFKKYSMENIDNRIEDGSGVGLFVVYNLIKKQNGNIKLESEIGKGSTFTIEFSRVKRYGVS
ncbi:sensor histidine kinase [Clostridium chauvoei]|uniref:histidine kinase n=5 Tax=Clostridium chauvoei TaxID=46867 RepID=S6ELP4_9CLOT|nr:HAMP domain-containing sensor histidine kinase [Clostridium chauvoei]MBX7280653.1 HAMP domain-containing histidine kinase [Clostridium chauvoei]MBX7283137.1 HAMP domain-containing histidine kinase [Clostridium chauvoei]MBX7285694.1 HAMP domain-containing histidine kinase [Clostridium chauvoei]MBX7288142.1 HAMP domain-containing histidine kinase [Clostridium chauvoei]MBX7290739.1 HAMP domain-containing histidine kinase [Clostridium chauvoei]